MTAVCILMSDHAAPVTGAGNGAGRCACMARTCTRFTHTVMRVYTEQN